MSRCECGSCREPLHDAEGHSECVACLGAALTETTYSHCESMTLVLLCSRITFFHEESAHGLLNEWYLKGCHQRSSHHQSALFLPAVHEELARMWRAPYSAFVNPSTSTLSPLLTVLKKKAITSHPPLEEAVVAPSALGLKAHAVHSSKRCRTTSALANSGYSVLQLNRRPHVTPRHCFSMPSDGKMLSIPEASQSPPQSDTGI